MHLKAITEADRALFEELAGLAEAGLSVVERNREWFLREGLRAGNCHDFWYRWRGP